VQLGRARDALALLDEAADAAGRDATIFAGAAAAARGRALSALGDDDAARAVLEAGIVEARRHAQRYELAHLLFLWSELTDDAHGAAATDEAHEILTSLGVQPTALRAGSTASLPRRGGRAPCGRPSR
jgi:hypothetical protein